MVNEKIKRNQITGRFQTGCVADVATARVQICQSKKVLDGQWRGRYLQRVADGSVQAGVGNGNGLRQAGSKEARQEQNLNNAEDGFNSHTGWRIERGRGSKKLAGLEAHFWEKVLFQLCADRGLRRAFTGL